MKPIKNLVILVVLCLIITKYSCKSNKQYNLSRVDLRRINENSLLNENPLNQHLKINQFEPKNDDLLILPNGLTPQDLVSIKNNKAKPKYKIDITDDNKLVDYEYYKNLKSTSLQNSQSFLEMGNSNNLYKLLFSKGNSTNKIRKTKIFKKSKNANGNTQNLSLKENIESDTQNKANDKNNILKQNIEISKFNIGENHQNKKNSSVSTLEEQELENLKFDLENKSIDNLDKLANSDFVKIPDYSDDFQELFSKIEGLEGKINQIKQKNKDNIRDKNNSLIENSSLMRKPISNEISSLDKTLNVDTSSKIPNNINTKIKEIDLNILKNLDLNKINNAIKIAEILGKECGNNLENCYLMKKKDLLLHHKSQRAIINAIFRLSHKIDK